MAASEPAPPDSHPHLIEGARRLSRSRLWRLNRAFYERRGNTAWTTGKVPWFVSANACLARAYALVIDGFLRDVAAGAFGPELALPTRPVHVIEVGAGHGRFAFLVLEHLVALEARHAALGPRAPLRYVVTDVAEANLAFCAEHPALRPHLDAGRLDLARYDAERDETVALRRSGVVLSPGAPAGALVVIANYLFDSLVNDVFRVTASGLDECLPALYSSAAEADPDDPAILDRVKLVYARRPAGPSPYGEPALDAILDDYRRTLPDTAVTFPIGALTCAGNLHRLAGGRWLLLASDKGPVHAEELLHRTEPQPVVHGSFSLSVNFHAIGAWFEQVGGHVLDVTPRDGSLTPNGFVAGARPEAVIRTRLAFADWIERFGPMDFVALQDQVRAVGDKPPTVDALLAILRLGDWDPWLFYRLADHLRPQLDEASEPLRRETRRALVKVWARYYHLGGSQDLPFELARVWQRLRNHDQAIELYRRSIELFGDSHVTHHNLGLCHYYGGQRYALARDEFERALALAPDYAPAREWKLKMDAELRGA